MKKFIFFFLIVVFASSTTNASHIVGGEFELLHISGTTYQLNLILYFDVINGNRGAIDRVVEVRIFRKRDNQMMQDVNIPLTSTTRVKYFQPKCSAGGGIITNKITYTTTIDLLPSAYNDQQGYYLAWERCCRNYTIDNVVSNEPRFGGQHAGQTYYLEFPAVVDKKGKPFINSSPQLFPPLSDYGCPFRPYWVDFAGKDVDGDSLVYSLTEPLSTHSSRAIPIRGPGPAPYPTVVWRSGYSMNNIMAGNPKLKVNEKGFLTVTPTRPGLFVFAVKCEEYRNKVKIGELIRDFQMFVLSNCPVARPPVIKGKKLTDTKYIDTDEMNVKFANTVKDNKRCMQIQVTDLDSSDPRNSKSEKITLKVVALNFDPSDDNLSSILPDVSKATLKNGGAAEFKICFPKCPFTDPNSGEPKVFKIGVIAFDDACALPLSDTLKLNVDIQPPTNNPPFITAAGSGSDYKITTVQGAGKSLTIPIVAEDPEKQDISLKIKPKNDFDIKKPGMSFSYTPTGNFEPAPIRTNFKWNLDCSGTQDFSEGKIISPKGAEIVKQYKLELTSEDKDTCNYKQEDVLKMELNVRFPGELAPIVYEKKNGPSVEYLNLFTTLHKGIGFDVMAKDGDTDNINLIAVGEDFDLAKLGASFQNKTNQAGLVTTRFNWHIKCELFDLSKRDKYRVFFIAEDIDPCKLANRDTLVVDINIQESSNVKPKLSFESTQLNVNQVTVNIREPISVLVRASDADKDSVFLSLLGVSGTKKVTGYDFKPSKGKGSTSSMLRWTPGCEYLDQLSPGNYTFRFTAKDKRCPKPDADTLDLIVVVKDIVPNNVEFIPPNVFTPNKDDVNEYFGMYKEIDGKLVNILPIDNCEGVFENVQIFNRWGREVYTSTDRNFKWFAKGKSSGVYFYQVNFSHKTYKGSVSILY